VVILTAIFTLYPGGWLWVWHCGQRRSGQPPLRQWWPVHCYLGRAQGGTSRGQTAV